jgi:1-acyl-sn-glycerol-3-phosphate acyltransferase
MQNIVIDKPYVPVPPYSGRIWPAVLARVAPVILARRFGIESVRCERTEALAAAVRDGHAVLIAPNHCRDQDPFVLGRLAQAIGSPVFMMASWHVFMQGRLQAFLLRRAGAFSVYREGIDRTAVNTAIDILSEARRPLVIFPEGHVSRTNDRLNALLDGTGLIARTAARRRAKADPPGKLLVFPVAIRYRFHGDIQKAASSVLDEIETRLTWPPRPDVPLIDRIYRVGEALLTLKELQYLGRPQTGAIAPRLASLMDSILSPLEKEWLPTGDDAGASSPRAIDNGVFARVKRLRTAILPDLIKGDIDESERQRRWRQLADLYLIQQLFHYPPDYVQANSTPERILETVERFEEDLTDGVRRHGSISATVTVGDAIEATAARESRGGPDPLMQQIESELRRRLGIETNEYKN